MRLGKNFAYLLKDGSSERRVDGLNEGKQRHAVFAEQPRVEGQ
jgi:hypothetical protein